MKIALQPITSDNWIDCTALTPTEEQVRIGFVAPNSVSLAQAHYEPWWQLYGLYASIDDQQVMVGFAMYGRWPATGIPAHHDNAKSGVDFIIRFMIDQRYQGRGYGRAGMAALLAQITAQAGVQAIEISYDIANPVMAHLCTQAGFQPTGRIDNGEIEARLLLQVV
ncbi:MAG: GNAT family N-acetyltransferase [Caldilineaceae bacterium]